MTNGFRRYFRTTTKVYQVFLVLEDLNWHCRVCEYEHVGTSQIAGSGGISGLRSGSTSRPPFDIETARRHCATCNDETYQDRWLGTITSE